MNELDRIVDQLQRAYDGDAWYGLPLATLLADVSAAEAAARPLPGVHSIAELALHIAAWMGAVTRRLATGIAEEPADGDWPPLPTPWDDAAWSAVRGRVDERERQLAAGIAALPASRLGERVGRLHEPPDGQGISVYATLHGIVQHNVYHTGQIALVKKALRAA